MGAVGRSKSFSQTLCINDHQRWLIRRTNVRSTKTVSFATGLRPGWNSKADATIKEPLRKLQQTHVEISAGGLEDSDIEGPNPFPLVPQVSRKVITERELTDGSKIARRDVSWRNDVRIFFSLLKSFLIYYSLSLSFPSQLMMRKI